MEKIIVLSVLAVIGAVVAIYTHIVIKDDSHFYGD